MNRKVAKELLPIIQAFAEGKLIQGKDALNDWHDINEIYLGDEQLRKLKMEYHIKPEPKYRPFKTQEECWKEMLKHEPFGWIIHTITEIPANISMVMKKGITFDGDYIIPYQEAFNNRTFTDGTPFGVEEK